MPEATERVRAVYDKQAPYYDPVIAVAERLLFSGGRESSPAVRRLQRMLDPLFVRLAEDHLLREPADAVRRAGLVIEEQQRSRLGMVLRLTARKP